MQEMPETWGSSPGGGDGTHSSFLAWEITWTEEPGGLQSMGSQRVGHDWACTSCSDTAPIGDSWESRVFVRAPSSWWAMYSDSLLAPSCIAPRKVWRASQLPPPLENQQIPQRKVLLKVGLASVLSFLLGLWSLKPLFTSLMLSGRLKQKIQPFWLFSKRDSVRKESHFATKGSRNSKDPFWEFVYKPMVFFTGTLTQSIQLNPLEIRHFPASISPIMYFWCLHESSVKNKNDSLNIQNIFNSNAEQNNLSIEMSVKRQNI